MRNPSPLSIFALIFLAAAAGNVAAGNCPLDAAIDAADASKMRAIARSCDDAALSRLYHNRAYAAELQSDYQTYLDLTQYRRGDSRDHVDYYAFRMFLALAEAFMPQAATSHEARLGWLNQAYDQANELAELRMRGYDRIADHRAREMATQESEL